jgi:hypothetical protein
MANFRRLFVPLLALTLLSASGIFLASAATASQFRDQTPVSGLRVIPPTIGTLGGGSNGGIAEGDPDDIIEGNRVTAVAAKTTTPIDTPARKAVRCLFRVGGVFLLLRRLLP